MNRPIVVSIGTTHPWNIAGVGLDLLLGDEFDVRVLTAIAAVSAQNARGLQALSPVPSAVVRAQLEAMPWERVDAMRIGAIASAAAVHEVAQAVRAHPKTPAVVDPVFAASLGGAFADEDVVAAIGSQLATLPNVILTPNLAEASILLGGGQVERQEMVSAAAALQALGAHAVLLKGGHLDGEPTDALATEGRVDLFTGERLPGSMRATGCVLAMALACELARGLTLVHAVQSARSFVRAKIARQNHFQGLTVAG